MKKINNMLICDFHYIFLCFIVVLTLVPINFIKCQIINLPPQFVPGSGDMARFSLSENTLVGSPVYQLRGIDPEGSPLRYSISGPVFSVDRSTGVVRLRQELDREKQDLIEVIISITDDGILGTEPNTVSLRREIPIRDYNDNSPMFIGRPYTTKISESTNLGSVIPVNPQIIVTDKDTGQNAEVALSCYDGNNKDVDVCDTFHVQAKKNYDGNFTGIVTLLKSLDFETRPSYILTIMAKDSATVNQLSSFATVSINVIDVQDQPPIFINAPYSATIQENTPEDTSILTITAVDGDTGNPRPILLTIENEAKGHFKLEPIDGYNNIISNNSIGGGGGGGGGQAILYTTHIPIDREDPDILQNGGVYSFMIKATELINNELPADFTYTQVTIVLTDIDDHLPEFNEIQFDISIPENLENDTSLPGLSIYVNDQDLGNNSKYNLSLRNVENAENIFSVSPTYGEGRTPIVVKIKNSQKLDYDVDDINLRTLTFDIIASSVHGIDLAMSRITVHLLDANDNSPIFTENQYNPHVLENIKINSKIIDIMATDKDSGDFGKIHYMLKGFGSDYFYTNQYDGGLYVKKNLDYEQQKSYSLTIVAVDGGGRETNANLFIDVLDENDNAPMFESLEYTRTVREGATVFEPQFYVRATDIDGPQQGGGKIKYSIESENSISGHVFTIDPESGELKIQEIAKSMDTERGEYELIIVATDYGIPSLKNTTRVLIRVGISGNQRPIFKGHFIGFDNIPGPPSYRVTIPENAQSGYNVTVVSATDPDGIDSLLRYKLVGANDNFAIDEQTGLVTVSNVSRLDRDSNPENYAVVISAVDAGSPIPETATTTLYVKIADVNDKPPKFEKLVYTAYISERATIGSRVAQVRAADTDIDSKIKYSIIEPIKAISKTGAQLTSTIPYDYRTAFEIDSDSGSITVRNTLNHNLVSAIILPIKAIDINAVYDKEKQFAIAEVTIYIQSFIETNPIFMSSKNWDVSTSQPVINFKIKEEMPIGSIVYTLIATDPLVDDVERNRITNFEIINDNPDQYFILNSKSGDIILKKRLDYEQLNTTIIQFSVKALSHDRQRQTQSLVNVSVENVNDNDPIFDKKIYRATVMETIKYPEKILTIHAIDNDKVLTNIDRMIGYNSITYSLIGSDSKYFHIDNKTGEIILAPYQMLDREQQSVIRLLAVAEDSTGKPVDTRRSTSEIIIEILDVNDNAPNFSQQSYTAVIPENIETDTFVANLHATDPDEGPGGEIHYEFINEGDANGLFKINLINGEIRTKKPLTGKGRSEPYEMLVRAQDQGGQIPKQKSLFTDVPLTIYIGDVSTNDGIPFFITPKIGQIANISEDASIGSTVFQVVASDPDSPSTPSGVLTYYIQDGIEDAKSFRIDAQSGLITTLKQLDREMQDTYNIIIEVTDNGQPRQAATRILQINILDVDDHKPRFIREIDSQPIEMSVLEEQPINTIIGNLTAIDEDINENGEIDYMFIDGNQENYFQIERTNQSVGVIKTLQRVDREHSSKYLLTIKCFKNGIKPFEIPRKSYNNYDMSQIQILINIIDIDDHLPEFDVIDPVIGVRLNTPINTPILTINAKDIDPDAFPIDYKIINTTFIPQYLKKDSKIPTNFQQLFILNNRTGEILTGNYLQSFVDGYFEIIIRANNSIDDTKRFTDNKIKIFIIRDTSLLKFVFVKPPIYVRSIINDFSKIIQSKLTSLNLELNILDTQILTRPDLSLDFSSTSACFLLTRSGTTLSPSEMQFVMDSDTVKQSLIDTYAKYSVSNIESCSPTGNLKMAKFFTTRVIWLIVLATIIVIGSLIAICSACYLSKKYRKQSKRLMAARATTPEPYSIIGPPIMYSESIYGAM